MDRSDAVSIAGQEIIADRELLQGEEVAWIQSHCALQITESFIVGASPPRDVGSQLEDPRRIGHCPTNDLELIQRAVVIAIRQIKMIGPREMRFAGVRPKLGGGPQSLI